MNGAAARPEPRSASSAGPERAETLDDLRTAAKQVFRGSFEFNAQSLMRAANDTTMWGIQVEKPLGGDRHGCHSPKIEHEGPGLAHGRRRFSAELVHARRLATTGPRLAGCVRDEGGRTEVFRVGTDRNIPDVSRTRVRWVFTRWEGTPNEIPGMVGRVAQPCFA